MRALSRFSHYSLFLPLIAPACALAAGVPVPSASVPSSATSAAAPTGIANPSILIGDPAKPGFPTPADFLDSNTPDSPFAGVVSIVAGQNFPQVLGSGVALSRYTILTAAHVVDFAGGLTPENTPTGDGIIDLNPAVSTVYLNNSNVPTAFGIASVQVMPTWHGFRNAAAPEGASEHDDLAIITLSSPLPANVPVYPIYRTPFNLDTAKIILMAGYGGAGNAINGVTVPASINNKHYGWNIANVYDTDEDTPSTGNAEVFFSDFDPSDVNGNPDPTQTGFDGFTSLGNTFEGTLAPGDSGGPSFLVDDLNNDGFIQADELSVFGIDTFTSNDWPNFNSYFGGQLVSAYAGFIDANSVPEPGALAMMAAGLPLLVRRRASRKSN